MQAPASQAIYQQVPVHPDFSLAARSYTPYGFHAAPARPSLGFAGELDGPLPRGYLLGSGKRVYDIGLMRFHSPDVFSPFDRGGVNAYAYCLGDPVNNVDRDGHSPTRIAGQSTGLVWGTVGMLSSLNKASKTIVKRSVAKTNGQPVPKEFDAASRTNNAMIFNGGLASTVTKIPGVVMAFGYPTVGLASEIVCVLGMGAASTAGVFKMRQLVTDMKATLAEARVNRIPLGKLAVESLKEATGWNRLRGQESAILEPLPEKVLLVRWPYTARTQASNSRSARAGKLGSTV
ncbi:MAG: RHS repeat-associated core domain-containing protein [Candidatus Pseudomonas phytovorans]|uniref:RHS repeat-associated core domain-containing protein n=1 Tax=Candidatus Pseudomonas phytovorans TaxID=3121377 RepID=A0AAJ6BA51_9PSED|nr:RHS repeat-associated core domain-containing protein [Pseudomonas sp.]WEK28354.1 MAG: RHS repeat-associated core domain-containing protein [Pseudomonas sp.]